MESKALMEYRIPDYPQKEEISVRADQGQVAYWSPGLIVVMSHSFSHWRIDALLE